MTSEILVPALGESVTEATVSRWLKQPGEAVAIDEPLVELETDKVTLEVNAQAAGSLAEIAVPEGETVEVGALLGLIARGAAGAAAPARSEPAAAPPVVPGGKILDMVVPALGESVAEAILSRWIKQEGDSVAADEPVAELETDKVTLEVNAPGAGVLQSLAVAEGDTVEAGALLAKVASGATPAAAAPAPVPAASAPPWTPRPLPAAPLAARSPLRICLPFWECPRPPRSCRCLRPCSGCCAKTA